jgi:riboflavin synthase
MFTGIIERTASISSVSTHPGSKRLRMETTWTDIRLGESIAVNGVCLTIADGHFVQGHVDGTAPVTEQRKQGGEWRLAAEAPAELAKFLVPKGSICLDGVSLTIAALAGRRFEVALIPTTLKITNLGDRPIGWPLNLEADIFSKTIVNWLERRRDWVEDQVK